MAMTGSVCLGADARTPSAWGGLGASVALALIAIVLGPVPTAALGAEIAAPPRGQASTGSAHGPSTRFASAAVQPGSPPPAAMTPPAQTMPAPAAGPTSTEEPAPEPVVLEGGISVAIGADQRATVLGETQSLRALVEEICRQARIDLRTYAAPDRRYVGKLERVPLTEALQSMLRSESYLLGFRAGTNGGPARITWMRVLGGQPGANGPVAAVPAGTAAQFGAPQLSALKVSPPPSSRFAMSTALLFQAFGTYDPVRRDQAQREMLDRINQPDELQRFLGTDAKTLATMFGRYRDSEQTIRRLKSMSESPEVQGKFQEVLNLISAPPAPAEGTPEDQ